MDSSSFFTAIGFEEISVAGTAVGLTNTVINDTFVSKVLITVETASIRYTYDGTVPTSTKGHLVAANGKFEVYGPENVANLLMIAPTPTAAIKATLEAV